MLRPYQVTVEHKHDKDKNRKYTGTLQQMINVMDKYRTSTVYHCTLLGPTHLMFEGLWPDEDINTQ